MKEMWEAPRIGVQVFVAGEYASNPCYSLYCEVAGDEGEYNKDTYFNGTNGGELTYSNGKYWWGDLEVTPDKLLHGQPCAEECSYNSESGVFYENGKASEIGAVKISEKTHSTLANWFYAVWGSLDVNGTGNYHHYGWAVFDQNYSTNHS